jgi:hypothetical protein
MKTTIPKPRTPDTGLSFYKKGNTYRAEYSTDGVRRYRTLRTDDIAIARERRDAFYAELVAAGATYPDRRMEVDPDDDRGIYPATGFTLRIHGKHIGYYKTREQAREAKRRLAERGTP